jgi:hypothetical protein
MNFSEDFLKEVHKHSFKNKIELSKSIKCHCFHCFNEFLYDEIEMFYTEKDGNQTAHCPYCLVDSLIGDASGFDLSDELIDDLAYCYFRGLSRKDREGYGPTEIILLD